MHSFDPQGKFPYKELTETADSRKKILEHISVMPTKLRLLACALATLAACTATEEPPQAEIPLAEKEQRLTLFRIGPSERQRVPLRLLNTINELRERQGLDAVQFSSRLNAAARTHSRDMSVQNRPWHFGSDGSSVLDRVKIANYDGWVLGENIAETFENDLQTLAAWLEQEDTRAMLLHPEARQIGLGWHQEENGKIWWVLVVGT